MSQPPGCFLLCYFTVFFSNLVVCVGAYFFSDGGIFLYDFGIARFHEGCSNLHDSDAVRPCLGILCCIFLWQQIGEVGQKIDQTMELVASQPDAQGICVSTLGTLWGGDLGFNGANLDAPNAADLMSSDRARNRLWSWARTTCSVGQLCVPQRTFWSGY